ncbi:hypothetical protein RvY_16596 [Ramazzottius varieornatus]|uniref:Reverse transcriptase domain-containing protein n=1 Tax=Ramazzottius varieornatus TaxID=947166 RepID=A0A1D1VZ23_RAMVA|nr:hypothetical protein RvY_16596 [Ramazzottius varieornatus]
MSNVRGNTDGELGKQLIFRYANLNGIKSKSEELKAWTERGKVDIGAFVETWADDSVTDTLIADLEKYKVHRKDRAGCRKEGGGGVAIIVQKDLHTLRATEYEVEGLELMWVKVVGMKMVALVGVLYAPGYDMEVFAKLRCSLEKIPPYLRRNMILVNDFNCPDIDWEDLSAKKPRTRELLSVIKEFALFQRVRGLTRERNGSSSCLDLLFVTQLSLVRQVNILPKLTFSNDHCGLQCLIKLWIVNFPAPPKPVWVFQTGSQQEFRKEVTSVNWASFFDAHCNSDVASVTFEAKVVEIAQKHFRLKKVGSRRLNRPSLSPRTIDSLKRRDAAFRKWTKTKDSMDYNLWVDCARDTKRLLKTSRSRQLRNIATLSRRCPEALWKYVKRSSKSESLPPIPVPGAVEKYLVHPKDKAEYIASVFLKDYGSCAAHCQPYNNQVPSTATRCKEWLPSLNVTGPEVWEVLRKLLGQKAAGSSLLTNALIKAAGTALVYPLTRLFNLVLCTKQYPTSWKKADVVPVPKKGGATWRPISLLSPLSKIFEKVLAIRILSFLEENRVLTTRQFGFRSKRSTEVQLLHMVHRWSQGLSEKKEVEAVFLDCTKAFDRVPHEVLVRSLQDHGITGDLLDLMADYLRGRTQRVTVGGYYSEYSEVRSGVPQGSVLGPLLFIVAVNKLSVSVRCELYQYADDLVAHQVISKPEDCRAFQESLDQLGENCEEAGLSLNPSKSQHVRISFKRSGSVPVPQGNYSISGQKIPTKSQTTCLGVVLDRKLNWTAQIDAVTAKCRKRLHAIRSYFPLQLGAARQLLYISLVRPVAEYACSVWNPTNHKHQRQLEQVQKDFLKSIRLSKIPKGQHDGDFSQYRQHLAEVKWDYLWTRRVKAVLVNGFKIWTKKCPTLGGSC